MNKKYVGLCASFGCAGKKKPARKFSSVAALTFVLVLEFRFKLSLLKASGYEGCLLDRDAGKREVLFCLEET